MVSHRHVNWARRDDIIIMAYGFLCLIPDFKKHNRFKRATTPDKSTCDLLLVADYRFFQEVGNSELVTTANYLVRC